MSASITTAVAVMQLQMSDLIKPAPKVQNVQINRQCLFTCSEAFGGTEVDVSWPYIMLLMDSEVNTCLHFI